MNKYHSKAAFLNFIIEQYSIGDLRIPDYQRGRVWDEPRKRDWAKAIHEGMTIPMFLVYQLPEAFTYWLADGCQRLYTTQDIYEHPEAYGFVDVKDFLQHISRCEISIGYLECDDHKEGYKWFRRLNMNGTTLTPAELFKGYLTDTEVGKLLYEQLPHAITNAVGDIAKPYNNRKKTRSQENRFIRDNLALFVQYTTQTPQTTFWSSAAQTISPTQLEHSKTTVEQAAKEAIRNCTRDEVSRMLLEFEGFLSGYMQMVRASLDKHHGPGKVLASDGTWRHLAHFAIYARNVNIPVKIRESYIDGVIKASYNGTARCLFNPSDLGTLVILKTDDLTQLGLVCEHLGIPLDNKLFGGRQKKGWKLKPGLENSHVLPRSKYGENETLPEPMPLNRSRGAEAMTLSEQLSLSGLRDGDCA